MFKVFPTIIYIWKILREKKYIILNKYLPFLLLLFIPGVQSFPLISFPFHLKKFLWLFFFFLIKSAGKKFHSHFCTNLVISNNLSSSSLVLSSLTLYFAVDPIQWIFYFGFCIFSSKISIYFFFVVSISLWIFFHLFPLYLLNYNICAILGLVSVDCLFPYEILRFSWFSYIE